MLTHRRARGILAACHARQPRRFTASELVLFPFSLTAREQY